MFGEGGGLSYLCDSYETEGGVFKMAGILPAESRITKKLQGLGYAKAKPLSPAFGNKNIRAHEFHYSEHNPQKTPKFAYEMIREKESPVKKTVFTSTTFWRDICKCIPALFRFRISLKNAERIKENNFIIYFLKLRK